MTSSEWNFTIARTERALSFSFFSKKDGQTEERKNLPEPLAITKVRVKWLLVAVSNFIVFFKWLFQG